MSKDMQRGKKLAVSMLKGPVHSSDMAHAQASAASDLRRKGLVTWKPYQGYTRRGTWQLTPQGLIVAAKWDYDLKLRNAHPDQEPIVTPPPAKVPEPVAGEEYADVAPGVWAKAGKADVDWQQRHIDFLEEIVRNMTSKHNV